MLSPGGGFAGYLWQNASTANSQNATTSGTYWVRVTDGNTCTNTDTVIVTINPVPAPNLGPDISFCSGQSATLNPGTFAGYLWNTTATTQTINVTTTGTYYVTVTNASGCTNTDTLVVQNVFPLPNPNLGANQSFCWGTTVILNPGVFSSYQWQDNSTSPNFSTSTSGNYFVKVTDGNNCQNSDTVIITVFPLPIFSLGVDVKICPGDNVTLQPAVGPGVPVTYQWQDNSTNSSLIIYNIGTYFLTVTDNNACTFTDTILVTIECPPTIYIPNSFTPNQDEINPLFRAYGTNIKEYKMEIFNRWGQLIHTMNSLTEGWDGTMNGNPAPVGQYVYRITYQNFLKADDVYLMGGFNLIR